LSASTSADVSSGSPDLRGQPAGLYRLFFAEMWERFSYYGMRALLVLYMFRSLLYDEGRSYAIYAAYGALVYATPMLGGWLADRVLGYKRSIVLGGLLMTVGHFVMAIETELFFFGAMSLIIIGNGFFKPNISSLLGTLYVDEHDPRRDRGFTIFYMGINLGAALAPLIAGAAGEIFGWHYGFGIAGVGMLIGLLVFLSGQKQFKGNGEPPNLELYKKYANWIYIGSFLIVPLIGFLVYMPEFAGGAVFIGAGIVLGYLIFEAIRMGQRGEQQARDKIFVILILLVFTAMFWSFFEQAGSSLTLFAELNVDRGILPTSSLQAVNPTFIILMAPVFTALWMWLDRRKKEPNTPVKFSLGLIQLGLGFGALVLGSFSAEAGLVPLFFLILSYFLQTTGELSLSPIGLSMVTKLSPARIVALVMGAWFLSSSFAHYIGGFIASATSSETDRVTLVEYIPSKEKLESTQEIPKGVEVFSGATDTLKLEIFSGEDTLNPRLLNVLLAEEAVSDAPVSNVIRKYATVASPTAELDLTSGALDPTRELSSFAIVKVKYGSVEETDSSHIVTYKRPASGASGLAQPLEDASVDATEVAIGTASATQDPREQPDESRPAGVAYAQDSVAALEAEVETATGIRDTLWYTVCHTEDATVCDTLEYVITLADKDELPVEVYREEVHVTVPKARKSVYGIELGQEVFQPAALYGYQLAFDPDGDDLTIQVAENPRAGVVSIKSKNDPRIKKERTLIQFTGVFYMIFLIATGTGIFLLLISPFIKRMMHGVK